MIRYNLKGIRLPLVREDRRTIFTVQERTVVACALEDQILDLAGLGAANVHMSRLRPFQWSKQRVFWPLDPIGS